MRRQTSSRHYGRYRLPAEAIYKTKNMKKFASLLLPLLLLVACGEESNEFVINGTINNLDQHSLLSVYPKGDGFRIDTLIPINGFIELKGNAPELTPVKFYSGDGITLLTFYVKNGDRIQINGNADNFSASEIKGSDLNKELLAFYHNQREPIGRLDAERRKSLDNGMETFRMKELRAQFDSIVEAYIGNNRSSVVSTILFNEYLLRADNMDRCDSILKRIDTGAKPAALLQPFEELQSHLAKIEADSILPIMSFLTLKDSTFQVRAKDSRTTLLYLRTTQDPTAKLTNGMLRRLRKNYTDDDLRILNVSLDNDSASWRQNITGEGVLLWAKDGYSHPGIVKLHITRNPSWVLVDSTGHIVGRNQPEPLLQQQIDSLLHPAQNTETSQP